MDRQGRSSGGDAGRHRGSFASPGLHRKPAPPAPPAEEEDLDEAQRVAAEVERHRAARGLGNSGKISRPESLVVAPLVGSTILLPPAAGAVVPFRYMGDESPVAAKRPPVRPLGKSASQTSVAQVLPQQQPAVKPWHAGKLFMRRGAVHAKKFKVFFVTVDESRMSYFRSEKDGTPLGWLELRLVKCIVPDPSFQPPPEAPEGARSELLFCLHVFSSDGFEGREWAEWECCALSAAEKGAWVAVLRQNILTTRSVDVLDYGGQARAAPAARPLVAYRCLAPFEPSDRVSQLAVHQGEVVELVEPQGNGWVLVRRVGKQEQGLVPAKLVERL
jgi:hypothetical protein